MTKRRMNGDIKRYSLGLPEAEWQALEAEAKRLNFTVSDLLRRFIRIGLLVYQADANGAQILVSKPGEMTTRIVIL